MFCNCLSGLFGCCATRDYELSRTIRVVVTELSIRRDSACICCKNEKGDNMVFFVLCVDEEAYNRALRSLQQFVYSKTFVYVKYVETLNGTYRVLTDVQEFIENLENNVDDSGESEITTPIQLLMDRNLHFTYNFDQGEVYWIAVLRTGQHGNRYPVDERLYPVVRYKTLDSLLATLL